ncbi:MAG: hypothetical protein RSE18_00150 [Acinetobacter sp.]
MKKIIIAVLAVSLTTLTACHSTQPQKQVVKTQKRQVGAVGTKIYLNSESKDRLISQNDWLGY